MKHIEQPSEIDTLKGLVAEQSTIIETLCRDNVELLAALKMVLSDEFIKQRLTDIKVMAILQNLLARIAEEKGEHHAA